MKTERITTQRKAHKYGVKDIVTEPAYSTALYRGSWAVGVAIIGTGAMVWYSFPALMLCGGILFIIGALLFGIGWGGDSAIHANWQLFKERILDEVMEDIHERHEDEGDTVRPFVTQKDNTIRVSGFKFTQAQWRKFFTTAIDHDYKVNTVTIRKCGIFKNAAEDGKDYIADLYKVGWIGSDGKLSQTALDWAISEGILAHPTD